MKQIFFDIDTQIDFMFPAGALYVPGAEKLIPIVRDLNRRAAAEGNIVISTMCAHTEDDPEFHVWPPHCVLGTVGQLKPAATLLETTVTIPADPDECVTGDAQQILLQKRQLDLFTNPNLRTLLDRYRADEYVVYGVVTEYCVRHAALGLLATGKPVTLATDATQHLDENAARSFYQDFESRGGKLARLQERLN